MPPLHGDPGASLPTNGPGILLDAFGHWIARAGHRLPWVESLRMRGLLTAEGALLGLLILLLPPAVDRLLRRYGRLELNFRGDRIPQSYGLVIVIWACALLVASAALLPHRSARLLPWLAACGGFGLLGLADDLWGTKAIKGLRGHLRSAVRDHVVTTGFVKALGGALLALWLGWRVGQGSAPRVLLAAGLIALSANAINLLDLRPGRATGIFLLAALPLIVAGLRSPSSAVPLLLVAIPTIPVWWRDSRAQVMIGDTGSNPLGACLGLAVAQTCSIPIQIVVLTLLIALHLLTERISLTRLIEQNPILRALDHLTGVR